MSQHIKAWFQSLSTQSFAYRDLTGIDRWQNWTPSVSLTVVGSPTYSGRYRVIGKRCEFQFLASCSGGNTVASTAGTHYVTLPMAAKGLAGGVIAGNAGTNVGIGVGVIDVTNSRAYLPTFSASTTNIAVCGWFEV